MQNYSLRLNDFKWAHDLVDIPKLLLTEEDSEWDYLADVEIEFPDELHDYFKDYPPAPSNEIVQKTDLSTDQVEMMGELGITSLPKVPKLIQSLQEKSGYVLHYLTLQLYIKFGVKVTHLHRVLQFRQCKWMASFVQMNNELRKKARNNFEESFYKLMINSSFGKTMESKRNRTKMSIVRNETELLQKLCQSSLKSFQILHEDLAIITFNPSSIRWNKPTIVGAVILDIAKKYMSETHYVQMKPNFNLEPLYSDTDRFIYMIKCDDIYEKLKEMGHLFDFSKYPKQSPLYNETHKKQVLMFKDEIGGDLIEEFVALKPKLYSLKLKSKW